MYSSTSGYYRPVQNWNDGKAQEFKDRKVYDIGHSHLTHTGPVAAPAVAEAPAAEAPAEEKKQEQLGTGRALLFVSQTCPNCKLAISLLEKEGFLFKKVVATENIELTNKYGVKQAPTLVVLGGGDEFTKFKGVSEIKGMLTARQAV